MLIIVVGLRINARIGRRYKLEVLEDLVPNGGADELVALVPGFTSGPSRKLVEAIREVRPTADIINFDYSRTVFSNANPFRIAEKIEEEIDTRHTQHEYKKITLLGYSLGALLIRKAYVYGCGNVADAPSAAVDAAVSREPKDWVKVCSRFVLLAGMNRGWNPDYSRTETGLSRRMTFTLGLWLAKLSHTGLLLRRAIRGEPFVANLRLQWLEVMRNAEEIGLKRLRVIQLLGDGDDVVSVEDSRDVTVARDFVWVTVNNTGHFEMCKLDASATGLERKRKIQMAFGDEEAIDRLKRTNPVLASNQDDAVRTVVFVLHGIRDMGEWTAEFEEPLQKEYLRVHQNNEKLYVHRASYGYFGMGPFLLLGGRQKNVCWFMDQVTELTARFPNMEEIHFIGHSNGTYILASALERYRTLRVKRVVLAGSVIRRDFRWSKFTGRVAQVRNYVAAGDLIVGLLPRVFELPFFGRLNRDIGSAGFNGFEDATVQSLQTRYIKGGHAAALVADNVPSMVEFIVHGTKTDIETLCTSTRSKLMQLVSNVCWLAWILGVVILIILGWQMPFLVAAVVDLFGSYPQMTPWFIWAVRASYVLIVWLILLTI